MATTIDLWQQQATPEPGTQAPAPAPANPGWREVAARAAWRVRAATIALWALIALAGAGGLRAFIPGPAQAPIPRLPDGAAGFAEQYVAAYLEAGAGNEASLATFYPGPVDLTGVIASGRYVSRVSAVAAARVGPGYWAITVAADVLDQVAGGYEQAGASYYRVGVRSSGAGTVATSLPAEVPAPQPPLLPKLAVPLPASPPGGDLGATLTAYFTRYLARAGPAPAGVTITAVGLGRQRAGPNATRTAEVDLNVADAAGRTEVLGYTLRLARTPAGWVVRAVLPAPPLQP